MKPKQTKRGEIDYVSPEITSIDIRVESGFAASSDGIGGGTIPPIEDGGGV